MMSDRRHNKKPLKMSDTSLPGCPGLDVPFTMIAVSEIILLSKAKSYFLITEF